MAGMALAGNAARAGLARTLVFGAATAVALAWGAQPARAPDYVFQDIINPGDVTFNQELGINSSGEIAGYFGSGNAGFPNKDYTTLQHLFLQRELPGLDADPGDGHQQCRDDGRLLVRHQHGHRTDNNFGFTDVGGTFTNVNNLNN